MTIQWFAIAATIVVASGAQAQTALTSAHNPMIKDAGVHTAATPANGRNSFTRNQAQGRIAKAGFSNIGKLAKTDDGIWQGSAMKGGKPVTVMLDYKGDVTAR